jgi:hypothetical protein
MGSNFCQLARHPKAHQSKCANFIGEYNISSEYWCNMILKCEWEGKLWTGNLLCIRWKGEEEKAFNLCAALPKAPLIGLATVPIYPWVVVATMVMQVTSSSHTATSCIIPYHTSKYTFGDARSHVKYIVYVVPGFGSNQWMETLAPSNILTTTCHVVY